MAEFEKSEPDPLRAWKPDFEIRFPPLPRTVADVSQLLAEKTETPDTPRLVEIVNSDPVIGASVLRRINSAYYGMRTRVADVQKACYLLGFEEVCDIVLTAGMMKLGDVFNSKVQIEIFERIMEMSLGAASYNKRLTQHLELPQMGLAFTTGLLHTVGRLVLLYNRPTDYEHLWYSADGGRPPSVTSEQIIFGTDHAELGASAAESWLLPDEVASVIRHHLTPGHVKDRDVRIQALMLGVVAEAAEQLTVHSSDGRRPEFSPPAALHAVARLLNVSAKEITSILESEREEVTKFIHSMVKS